MLAFIQCVFADNHYYMGGSESTLIAVQRPDGKRHDCSLIMLMLFKQAQVPT